MINLTKTLEMTEIVYLPQLMSSYCKHCNCNFYVTTRSFKNIYLSKYTGKGYIYVTNPFKVVVIK